MASACDAIVAERFDAGDPEGVAGLFAQATYGAEGGPVREGSEAVLAALRGAVVLHDGLPRTKHVVTNELTCFGLTEYFAASLALINECLGTNLTPREANVSSRRSAR